MFDHLITGWKIYTGLPVSSLFLPSICFAHFSQINSFANITRLVSLPCSVTCDDFLLPPGSSPNSSAGPWRPSTIGSYPPSQFLPHSPGTFSHFPSSPQLFRLPSLFAYVFSRPAYLLLLPSPKPPLSGWFSPTQSAEHPESRAMEEKHWGCHACHQGQGRQGTPTLNARMDWQQRLEPRQNSLYYWWHAGCF